MKYFVINYIPISGCQIPTSYSIHDTEEEAIKDIKSRGMDYHSDIYHVDEDRVEHAKQTFEAQINGETLN